MTRLDIVGSFSRHAGPRRLCERYPSSHCEVTTPPDAGYCDAGGCPLGIDKVGASDGDLVRRVLAGDTGAYAALVARYRDRLGRYAVHMLGDRQDAEEALQDAFVRAYRSLARCDDPERFGAWLYGILVNRCRTTGGRAARRARLFVRNDAALSGVALPSPAERAEWDDTVRRGTQRGPSRLGLGHPAAPHCALAARRAGDRNGGRRARAGAIGPAPRVSAARGGHATRV